MNNNVIKHGFIVTIQVWSYAEQRLLDCFVNAQDFARANEVAGAWYAELSSSGLKYVVTKHQGRTILLHRWILELVADTAIKVDHIDSNGLNNRRINLQICNKRRSDPNKLVQEYRDERAIAKQVQNEFQLTRMTLYKIRTGRTKLSEAAQQYDNLCISLGIRNLFYLKQASPRQKKFGVERQDGHRVVAIQANGVV